MGHGGWGAHMRRMMTTAAIAAAGLVLAACGSGADPADPSASASRQRRSPAPPRRSSSGPIRPTPRPLRPAPRPTRGRPASRSWSRRSAPTSTKIRDDITEMAPQGQGTRPVRRAERLGRADWPTTACWRPSTSRPAPAASGRWRSDGFTYEARTYGVPFATENLALFRNTDLAPEVPESIDVMARDGLELADKDDRSSRSPCPWAHRATPTTGTRSTARPGARSSASTLRAGTPPTSSRSASPASIEAAQRLAAADRGRRPGQGHDPRRRGDGLHLRASPPT